jgi:hypothetical protein
MTVGQLETEIEPFGVSFKQSQESQSTNSSVNAHRISLSLLHVQNLHVQKITRPNFVFF